MDANVDIAARLIAAIEVGDGDAVRALYADDFVVWHNNDGATQTVDQNLATLAWIAGNVKDFRYEDVRCEATDSGFVEQHITRGFTPKGTEFAFPACIVGTIVDGRITRIDEYLDSAHLAVFAS